MEKATQAMIIVPLEEWNYVWTTLQDLSTFIKNVPLNHPDKKIHSPYITAIEFMAAVSICRSNFDKLVHRGKIMTLKKGRKVYVVASEVERYFKEVEV